MSKFIGQFLGFSFPLIKDIYAKPVSLHYKVLFNNQLALSKSYNINLNIILDTCHVFSSVTYRKYTYHKWKYSKFFYLSRSQVLGNLGYS